MTLHRYTQCECGHPKHDGKCPLCPCPAFRKSDPNPIEGSLGERLREIREAARLTAVAALTIAQSTKLLMAEIDRRLAGSSRGKPKRVATLTRSLGAPREARSMSSSAGPEKLLNAIAFFGPLGATHAQLSVATGFTKNTRNTYARPLVAEGLVERHGSSFVATPEGARAATSKPLRGKELREWWLAKLDGGPASILRLLLGALGGSAPTFARTDIEDALGFTKNTVNTYLRPLIATRLVQRRAGAYLLTEEFRAAVEAA